MKEYPLLSVSLIRKNTFSIAPNPHRNTVSFAFAIPPDPESRNPSREGETPEPQAQRKRKTTRVASFAQP